MKLPNPIFFLSKVISKFAVFKGYCKILAVRKKDGGLLTSQNLWLIILSRQIT
jgi:hypothetical protein